MIKFLKFLKNNWGKAIMFVLGVIVTAIITVLITKSFDKIIPNDPVIVKEVNDSIIIIHKYEDPENLKDVQIKNKKLKVTEVTNDIVDNNIKLKPTHKKIEINNNKSNQLSIQNYVFEENLNLPISIDKKWKGYSPTNISSYAYINCPSINDEIFLFSYSFLNKEIIDEIAYLKCSVTKEENGKLYFISEDYYQVKSDNNIIGIVNNFEKNKKYIFELGFILKKDLNETYPRVYQQKCTLNL